MRLMGWMGIICSCAMVPTLVLGAEMEMQQRQQRLEQRQRRQFEQKLAAELFGSKPVLRKVPNSITFHGSGVPELYQHGRVHHVLHACKTVGLATSKLYILRSEDFDQEALYFHVDTADTFPQRQKAKLDKLKADLAACVGNKQLTQYYTQQAERFKMARTPADFDTLQWVEDRGLSGDNPHALTPAQFSALVAAFGKQHKAAEDLAKLLAARNNPAAAANEQKIADAYTQLANALAIAEKGGTLFTPAQRIALGYDMDPNFKAGRRGHGMSIGASASVGDDIDKHMAEMNAKYEALKKAAKVRFTLKGNTSAGGGGQTGLALPNGTLTVWYSGIENGTAVEMIFGYEPKTWAESQSAMLKDYNAMSDEKKKSLDEATRIYYQSMAAATSVVDSHLRPTLELIKLRASGVTPEIQEQYNALIQSSADTAVKAEEAYRAVEAKPQDAVLQKKFFDAYVAASKAYHRAMTLSDRHGLAEDRAMFKHVPWLFTQEQLDLVASTEPTVSVSSRSGAEVDFTTGRQTMRTLNTNARPQGKKQYVGITAENAYLEDVADEVQESIHKFYLKRNVKVTLDAALLDNLASGIIEGTSPDELIKSLARCAKATLVEDPKTPGAWILKP